MRCPVDLFVFLQLPGNGIAASFLRLGVVGRLPLGALRTETAHGTREGAPPAAATTLGPHGAGSTAPLSCRLPRRHCSGRFSTLLSTRRLGQLAAHSDSRRNAAHFPFVVSIETRTSRSDVPGLAWPG